MRDVIAVCLVALVVVWIVLWRRAFHRRPAPFAAPVEPAVDEERDAMEALLAGRCRTATREVERLIVLVRAGTDPADVVDGLLELRHELTKVGSV